MKNKKVVYDLYQLKKSDDPVFLSVTIGHAQDGSTEVKLDGDEVGDDSYTNSFRIQLGENNALDGKELKLTSLITDVQPEIDVVSITIVLSGGVEPGTWVLVKNSQDHETYPFRATIGLNQ